MVNFKRIRRRGGDDESFWRRGKKEGREGEEEEEEEAVSMNREPHCLSRKAFPAVGCHRKHSLRRVAC